MQLTSDAHEDIVKLIARAENVQRIVGQAKARPSAVGCWTVRNHGE